MCGSRFLSCFGRGPQLGRYVPKRSWARVVMTREGGVEDRCAALQQQELVVRIAPLNGRCIKNLVVDCLKICAIHPPHPRCCASTRSNNTNHEPRTLNRHKDPSKKPLEVSSLITTDQVVPYGLNKAPSKKSTDLQIHKKQTSCSIPSDKPLQSRSLLHTPGQAYLGLAQDTRATPRLRTFTW